MLVEGSAGGGRAPIGIGVCVGKSVGEDGDGAGVRESVEGDAGGSVVCSAAVSSEECRRGATVGAHVELHCHAAE